MIISISEVIIIIICIIISIIFMIFINRDKFSFNCKKNREINRDVNDNLNTQTSIKFDDQSDFEDNIKLISNINKRYANEEVLELL
jgi:hypothetical protein